MATQTKGFCKYCGKEYTRGGMLRHLDTCKKRKIISDETTKKRRYRYFQIVISAKYNNAYWLIIEISENATLKELDKFIRDIWVECCGHLSAFTIYDEEYESVPDVDMFWGEPSNDMNYRLKNVVNVGDTISYEYDFGSTTELTLKVHSSYEKNEKESGITILSRNNPLEFICSYCETNKAKWVDPQRFYKGTPFWCEECLREDCYDEEEDEYIDLEESVYWESLLPICNSPRMGVCGYEGSDCYPDQFIPDEK